MGLGLENTTVEGFPREVRADFSELVLKHTAEITRATLEPDQEAIKNFPDAKPYERTIKIPSSTFNEIDKTYYPEVMKYIATDWIRAPNDSSLSTFNVTNRIAYASKEFVYDIPKEMQ